MFDYENSPQMIEKEQWPPIDSPNLNTMKISCLGSKAQNYFETFIRSPNTFGITSRTGEDVVCRVV